jgi:hypothetical protein
MPITPAQPFPKAAGQTIRSADWNQTVNEVIRLDTAKVDRAGDRLTGPLRVDGHLTVGPHTAGSGQGRLEVSGAAAELGFMRRNLAAAPAAFAPGDRFVWYSPDGSARLFTDGRGDILTISSSGAVALDGPLTLPKTAGTAVFSNAQFSNEAQLQANNLKLIMANRPGIIFPNQPPFTYEFAVGHTFTSIIIGGGGGGTTFERMLGVTSTGVTIGGTLTVTGAKSGYIVDFFVNGVGETLQQGDVVVIGGTSVARRYGAYGDIPIPEVDLTTRAYDTRVCGIVASFVTAADLPLPSLATMTEDEMRSFADSGQANPLADLVPAGGDRTRVNEGQLGKMVTLGAYAHCKVDADIAPILAGDLLTTSPTPGHAQKVTEPARAAGCTLGKALSSLPRGKAAIPVLVHLG